MTGIKIGYARVSTTGQDLTAQRTALAALGAAPDRVYVDHGLTGTNRDRPGLREALAACRAGDTLVVTKLDRLARSVPDARDIVDELTRRGVKLNLGGSVHDPTDPVGRLLFNVLAMVAEFEADLARARTREGMAVAKAKGRLRGKQPKLSGRQEAHLVALWRAGTHTTAELAELFTVARSTVYRAIHRAGSPPTVPIVHTAPAAAAAPTGPMTDLAAHPGSAPAPVLVRETAARRGGGSDLLEAVAWPDGYRPNCPACAQPTTGLQEKLGRIRGVREPVVIATALPCGCHVDEHAAALQTGAASAPGPAPRSRPGRSRGDASLPDRPETVPQEL